ncbi:MAG: Gfo/Idh/MocA family oxidoreductase [Ferruginibacter sp.]
MTTIKWGIIGCGEVTEMKSGPAFNKINNSSLVAVMRRNGEKGKDYALRHNVPKCYMNADQLINDPDVNSVYIATPPLFHEQYAIAAMKAGKAVYVEKPMAVDTGSARRMLQVANEYNGKLVIAHYRREHPFFKKIKSLIDENAIGDIRFIKMDFLRKRMSSENLLIERNSWRVDPKISGGGLFYDLAPHQLDLMLFFCGEVEKVSGYSLNRSKTYNADDCTTANMLFKNGTLFNGVWCFDYPAGDTDRVEIAGSKGTIHFSVFGKQEFILTTKEKRDTILFETPMHVQQPLIEKVVTYFLGNGKNPSSAENGMRVMELMEEITRQ